MNREIRALIIRPDGVTEEKIGQDLDTLQELVGGYVETVRLSRTAIALVNEDGKAHSLPVNRPATLLADVMGTGLHPDDHFSGTVVVVGEVDYEGYFMNVPREIVEMMKSV